MSKDIFRNVFGITDQQAGRLINFGDKKDIKNVRDYLKLSIPLQLAKELFLNVGREKIKAKEEINDVLGPQVKIATAEYNSTEAKKIRDELGISDTLIRLSIGIEDISDLKKSLDDALKNI